MLAKDNDPYFRIKSCPKHEDLGDIDVAALAWMVASQRSQKD